MMKSPKTKIFFIVKISDYFPNNKLIFFIILFFRFLALFVITHDFNLYYGKGISNFLRKILLIELIFIKDDENKNKKIKFFQTIVIFLFIISIYIIIIPIIIYKQFKRNFSKLTSNQKLNLKIISYMYFFITYALNQFNFSIFVELVYIKNKNWFYYAILIIIFFLFILFVTIDIIVSLLINKPLFIENNNFISSVFTNYNSWSFYLTFYQIFLQIEMHYEFKKFFFPKNIFRFIYTCYYIFDFFSYNHLYVKRKYDYSIKFIKSLCFSSCIIEWTSFFDYKNDLIVLIEDSSSIIIKLLLEIVVSIALTEFYYYREINQIKIFINNLASNDLKTNNNFSGNKFLNLLYYREDMKLLINFIDIIYEKNNNNIKSDKLDLKTISENKNKKSFDFLSFLKEKDDFCNNIENLNENNDILNNDQIHILKEKFPSLFEYLKNNFIEIAYKEKQNNNDKKYLENNFILATFYYVFDRNFFQTFYIIENLKKSKNYKENFFCKLRIEQFYFHVKKRYKIYLKKYSYYENIEESKLKIINKISESYINLKNLNNIIISMNIMRETLNLYLNIMNKFFNEMDVKFCDFENMVFNFNKKYRRTKEIIKQIINKNSNNFSEIKILLNNYNSFLHFFEKNLKNYKTNSNNKNLNTSSIFLSNVITEKLIIPEKELYIIIVKAETLNEGFKYNIEYISEKFLYILKYRLEEYKNLNFSELFPKNFSKKYLKLFNEKLKDGTIYLTLNDFYIVDKDKYCSKYSTEISVLFRYDGLRLFFTIFEKDKNEENFILTNKNGKIICISKEIYKIFFMSSKIFIKCKIFFNDLFLFNVDEKNNKKEFNLNTIYQNIYNLLMENYVNDISQKIGEEEYSLLIIKIKEILSNLNSNKSNLIIKFYNQKIIFSKEKEYYCINIKIYNSFNKTYLLNLDNFFLSETTKTIQPHFFNYENDNENDNFKDKQIIYNLKERVFWVKKISIEILNIFYRFNINEINLNYVKRRDSISEDIRKTHTIEHSLLNEVEHKNIYELININKPNIKIFTNILLLLSGIIFFILLIMFVLLKIQLINKQENYVNMLIYIYIFKLFVENSITNILFHQLQNNNLQNKTNYWESFFNFAEETIYVIRDLSTFSLKVYSFYQNHIFEVDEYFTYLLTKDVVFNDVLYNGSKIKNKNDFASVSNIARILRYIINYGKEVEVVFNKSDIYFDNIGNDSDLFFTKKAVIIYLENYITIYHYFLIEFQNSIPVLAILDKFNGQKKYNIYSIVVSFLFSISILICLFIFIRSSKILYIRNFITYNQIIYFHIYLQKKIIFLMNFINFSSNESLEKISNLRNKIKFFNDKEEHLMTERLIKKQQFENVNQIRLKPFKIINANNSFKKINELRSINLNKKIILSRNKTILNSPGKHFYKKNKIIPPNNEKENFILENKKKKNSTTSLSKMGNLSNASSINSTKNSMISTINSKTSTLSTNNLITNQNQIFDNSGHKLVNYPVFYLTIRIILPILCLIFIAISFIDLNVTNSLKKNTESFLNDENIIFFTLYFIIQLIHIHIFSILKNENLIANYNGTYYISFCNEIDYIRDQSEHNMFNEIITCFPNYLTQFMGIINGNINTKLSNSKRYFNKIQDSNFCYNFIENLRDSKDYFGEMYVMQYLNLDELLDKCNTIGNKFNSKGINNIVGSIYSEIVSLHYDFLNNNNRTENDNFNYINNENLLILQDEVKYIFFYLPLTFVKVFDEDYHKYKDLIVQIIFIFIIADFVMILIIDVINLLIFKNLIKREKNIIEFTERLANSIIF